MLACIGVQAQTVYKYQMPDGRILYSTEVQPQGKLLETIKPAPAPASGNARPPPTSDGGRSAQRVADLEAADAEVKEASRALAEARKRQEAGIEPEEGERVGTVRAGRGRAREEYLERQRELQDAVDAAQKRLDAAYKRLNELR
jgi:hypothetical protein